MNYLQKNARRFAENGHFRAENGIKISSSIARDFHAGKTIEK